MNPCKTARAAAAAALALLSAALVLLPDSSFALDLLDSYERALQTDPTLRAADAALLAGREKAVQGKALLKPQVTLSASLSHVVDRSSTSLPAPVSDLVPPSSSGNTHQAALRLSQPLYDMKAKADNKQLQQQTGLAEISYRNSQQELMQRVGEAYFDLLLAQENLRVVLAEKAAVAMQRERAQARFDVGRGKITDLQEAQARYDSIVTKEVSAQNTLALRQAQYRELTGAQPEGLARLRGGFVPTPPQPDDLIAWQAKGLEQSPRVQAKRGELAIASAEIEKFKLSGRPTLDLVASVSHRGGSSGLATTQGSDSSRAATLGLQFNMPLYSGGALNSRERESIAKKTQAEQELSAAQRDTRLQVQDAFLAVKTGVSRIGSLEQQVRSAQTALEGTALGRDVGSRTELDVLDAQQRLYSAQLDLAQARNDYLLGRIRLASAAGELQPSELQALNGYLAQ